MWAKADGYRIATSTLGTAQQEAVPVRCTLPDSCIGFLLSHQTRLLPSPRASAKAVADGFCSGNSCFSEPLSVSAGSSHGVVGQAGHAGSTTEQDGWEGKTITRHVLSLCSEEASRDLPRGKDQSWIQESTFPRCIQQLQQWRREERGLYRADRAGEGRRFTGEGRRFFRGCWKEAGGRVTQCLIAEKSGRLQGSTDNNLIAVMLRQLLHPATKSLLASIPPNGPEQPHLGLLCPCPQHHFKLRVPQCRCACLCPCLWAGPQACR